MKLFSYTYAYTKDNPFMTFTSIVLTALGMGLMTVVLLFGGQLKDRLYRDAKGIDVVIGAKGSPLQLTLSAVQHLDSPVGNIPFDELERVRKIKEVKSVIPLALGDNYHQFRIVGSDKQYLDHFNAVLSEGRYWNNHMEAVIGASVASKTGLKLGDKFAGYHGLLSSGMQHTDTPYKVVGILKPSGLVADRLIFCSYESVWLVHGDELHDEEDHDDHKDDDHKDDDHKDDDHKDDDHKDDDHKDDDHKDDDHKDEHHKDGDKHAERVKDRELTALLVSYRNRMFSQSFPYRFNKTSHLQAVNPNMEIARLVSFIGLGVDSVVNLGIFLILISLTGVFLSLLNAIRSRFSEFALLRVLGASPKKIFFLIILQGMSVIVFGSILGLFFGYAIMFYLSNFTDRGIQISLGQLVFDSKILFLFLGIILLSFLISLFPAIKAYKMDVKRALDRL